jgi:hypothetical protein
MTDLTEKMLAKLRENLLPGLDLGEQAVHPYYQGLSLLNIPSSICRWLGAPDLTSSPLPPEIIHFFGEGKARRVVFVLVDGLGLHQFQEWLRLHPNQGWSWIAQDGLLAPATSVVPSTTSAALTTLWTGRSPAEHGTVGYELWLKEYGLVANMIRQNPASFEGGGGPAGNLSSAGFNPETALPWPTLGTHLASNGVNSYAFQHISIARSGLSRMFLKDVNLLPFFSYNEMWINLRSLLESAREDRLFAWVYWGDVDLFGHIYGPEDERFLAEFTGFNQGFQEYFLDKLSQRARQDTLIVLMADHGMIHTPHYLQYHLHQHPNLLKRLHILPTGEHRLFYLHPRPGQVEPVREYIQHTWPGQFKLLDSDYAVEKGLFGPGPIHPGLIDRVGDLIGIAQAQAYLWGAAKENHLLGRHGGLSAQEMLVPFAASWL